MKSTYLLVIVVVLALCAVVSRYTARPAADPRKLLIGRWQAVDLPPMCFSWDYQFREDGTGTQFYDNGAVMGTFRYACDGDALEISSEGGNYDRSSPLRFLDVDNFELAGPSLTIRFHRRHGEP